MSDLEKMHRFLHHPLYRQACHEWMAMQQTQIKKGAEKYPEPLNPASWTTDELIDHAVQENVDQMHYLTALRIKIQEMEKDIQDLLNFIRPENGCYPKQIAAIWLDNLKKKYQQEKEGV